MYKINVLTSRFECKSKVFKYIKAYVSLRFLFTRIFRLYPRLYFFHLATKTITIIKEKKNVLQYSHSTQYR